MGALGTRVHNEIIAPGKSDVVIVTLADPLVIGKETRSSSRHGCVTSLVAALR